jgi:hypothetical protein
MYAYYSSGFRQFLQYNAADGTVPFGPSQYRQRVRKDVFGE